MGWHEIKKGNKMTYVRKTKKEIEPLGLIITIAKENVSPEEHKRRKVDLIYFLYEQGKKLKNAN